jgi:LDH2 family malate/lactate/ureidoglycolate dehydrogenase
MRSLRLPVAQARAFCLDTLKHAGYTRADAQLTADALVDASLRGIDSHGLTRLLSYHARQARDGHVDTSATPALDARQGACATIDGRHAPGLSTSQLTLETAMESARAHGVGVAVARNVGYLGALGWCVRPGAAEGLIAVAACNSEPCVAPHGGRQALHGTNPIAVAVPAEPHPIVLDMRTNALRMADYWAAVATGSALPAGTMLSRDGEATTSPTAAEDGVYLPLAGAKGYALALIVDVLAPALSGGPIGREVAGGARSDLSLFSLVLDPALFGVGFGAAIERLLAQVHATAPLDESLPVLVPGERGEREYRERLEQGIPISLAERAALAASLAELGLTVEVPG